MLSRRRAEATGYGGDWPAEEQRRPVRKGRWIAAAVAFAAVATGVGAAVGINNRPNNPQWRNGEVAAAVAPVLAGLGSDARQPTAAGVTALLGPLFADSRLGGHVTASVIDVATGQQLFDRDGTGMTVPASTAKLATAAAVLEARGPAYQIPTRAVAGASPGEVVIIGGGDPTLAAGVNASYPGAARLDDLAGQVVKALAGQSPTKVIIDVSVYSGPMENPGWEQDDLQRGYIARVAALMTDGGRRDPSKMQNPSPRYDKPDLAAGQQFAAALGLPASAVTFGSAPAGGRELGKVLSPPISRQVEIMLVQSDNDIAEGMARQVAIAKGMAGSFDGGKNAIAKVLGDLGLPVSGFGLVDGSGMSYNNHISAGLLTAVLAKAASADHPKLRPILSGLPVAGYSGTLDKRYNNPAAGGSAAGTVRAKTGTLASINSLAGLAVDSSGRLLAFSVLADQTSNSGQAEAAMDRIAAALAGCGCF